jgi:hypothetical protein
MFKMQVQDDKDDPRSSHDVKGPGGSLLTFEKEAERPRFVRSARAPS